LGKNWSLEQGCCKKYKALTDGKYLIADQDRKIIFPVRYAESSYFPLELREFRYCIYCGLRIQEHVLDKRDKKYCLPFATSADPDHGLFVRKLESGKAEKYLFNLVTANDETLQAGLDYPSPTHMKYCPYCGHLL
jgi:hypothetical protein